MSKKKKIFVSMGVLITSLYSKVLAKLPPPQSMYAVDEPYDVIPKKPTAGEIISRGGKMAIPILLFFIGLGVIISKKITKKVKAIAISVLVILAVLGYSLMNYIAANF